MKQKNLYEYKNLELIFCINIKNYFRNNALKIVLKGTTYKLIIMLHEMKSFQYNLVMDVLDGKTHAYFIKTVIFHDFN
jgi:hypothetical protein